MRRFLMALTLLLAAGCGSLNQQYVEADRQTYDALAPRVRTWIEAEPTFDSQKKEDFTGLMDSWEARIRTAEEALAQEGSGD